MGKTNSKLPHTPSFDHLKSATKSNLNRKKNPSLPSQVTENGISISNEKLPRFVESTLLVWLDISSEKQNETTQKTLNHFRRVINLIRIFSDLEKCYQFLITIKDEQILFVVSGSFGPQILPRIENFNAIYSIYIFCGNKSNHIEWIKPYRKIKGIYTQIKELCDVLRSDSNLYDKSLTPISILPSSTMIELNQGNKTFIYLQVMKSILLEIQYEKRFRRELMDYARQFYLDNELQLNIIDTFEENYHLHSPIWWYTRKCFIYRMLRKAFDELDFEMIYKLAFFIRDLHRDIKKAYLQTHNHQYHPISVYRGARITVEEFENMEKNQKGLLSFNDFLITTLERSIAVRFAQKLRNDPNIIPVIYKLDIDPSKSSIPFIALNNLTYLSGTNGEILLSMNTIFHIDSIERVSDRLYEITLSPASKKDEQITSLVDYMQNITDGLSGWYKLSKIMIDVKEYDQVEHIYKYIYDHTNEHHREERAYLHHELGYISELKNNLPSSISHYQQAIDIYSHYLSAHHPTLLTTYNNLAAVLQKRGDLIGALEQYRHALKTIQSDDENIALQYNNIALILQQQGKYSEAQQTLEKTIYILLHDFPTARLLLADTYYQLGGLFYSTRNYTKALSSYENSLEIEEKSHPSNHASLASTYFNLATTYEGLKDYTEAIKHAQKAVEKARLAFDDEHFEVKENLDYLQQLQEKANTVKS